MIGFILKRLATIPPTLFVVASLVFLMVRLAPGGPFDDERAIQPEIKAQIEARYHLRDPLLKQYKDWIVPVVTKGDFGPTFKYPNRTVTEIIALSLPVSMKLGALALILALGVGVPLGVAGAARRNTWIDTLSMGAAMIGISVPRFVLAPLLVLVFALGLGWLPPARWETWRHLILPVVSAGLPLAAVIARLTRAGMLDVLGSDYIRTARAKGLPERTILFKHALRGGLLPLVSYLGPAASGVLVGSVVVEKIFNIPGLGRYFIEAALNREYNLLPAVAFIYGAVLMTLNALVDVAYRWLDPRVELR